MAGFSAWTFTGAAGVAYRSGIAAIGLYIGNALSFLLGYFVFAKRWRRSRITTVMEYLSGRFNPATHQVFSWTTIVFQLFTSASTLFGLSLFVSSACGFPVTWTILGAGALIVFYCVLGGLWAVVVTDFLQASILMPFCMVLVVMSLARVGGVSGLVHSLPPEMKTLHVSGEFGWLYIASWTIMVSFGYNTSAMAQRYFSVDDERSARKIALLCCGLVFRWGLLVVYSADGDAGGLSGTAPHGPAQCQRSGICGRQFDVAAAWPDWSHVGGHVQRHHGKSFRPVQREIGDPHQGCLSIAVSQERGRTRTARRGLDHDFSDRRSDDRDRRDHGRQRAERVPDHADIQHADVAGLRASGSARTGGAPHASVVRSGLIRNGT